MEMDILATAAGDIIKHSSSWVPLNTCTLFPVLKTKGNCIKKSVFSKDCEVFVTMWCIHFPVVQCCCVYWSNRGFQKEWWENELFCPQHCELLSHCLGLAPGAGLIAAVWHCSRYLTFLLWQGTFFFFPCFTLQPAIDKMCPKQCCSKTVPGCVCVCVRETGDHLAKV